MTSKVIAGVDEVGRGPLAGPVVSCAYILKGNMIPGVMDSKKLSRKKREFFEPQLKNEGIFSIGISNVDEIDEFNILQATKLSIIRAVEGLAIKPQEVIVDGNMKFDKDNYTSIIKADEAIYQVSAASIIAKVYRDNILSKLSQDFPEYGWEQNSAYGTKKHIDAILKFGLTKHHRKSFCKRFLYSNLS